MANLKGVIVTVLLSQTAWVILYLVETFSIIEKALGIFFPVGALALLGMITFIKLILPADCYSKANKRIEKRGLIFYMSCLFSWSCIVDGIFYLEAVGLVTGFSGFYLKTGEPYLGASFGTLCDLWDATVHYLMHLRIVYCIDNGKDYRDVLLFYLGSMLSSMVLLLIGGLGGVHGDFYSATFLNTPYVILPIYVLLLTMNSPRPIPAKWKSEQKLNNISLRLFLTIELIAMIVYGIIRGWAAMGSPYPAAKYYVQNIEPYLLEPSKFGYTWAMVMLNIGFIYQVSSLYALYHPGCSWILDWSVFFAGFQIYGSVLMMAQFFTGVAPEYHPPSTSMAAVVVLGNFTVALVAVLTAYLAHSEPGYFISPSAAVDSTKKKK